MKKTAALSAFILVAGVNFSRAGEMESLKDSSFETTAYNISRGFSEAMNAPVAKLLPGADAKIAAAGNTDDEFIRILRDTKADPDMRVVAAKALKERASFSYQIRNALMDVAGDGRDVEKVRREALKSLSRDAQNNQVSRLLTDIAENEKESKDFRALSVKALYLSAPDGYISSKLVDALRDTRKPPEIRQAAAWALSMATGQMWVRDALRDYAEDLDEDESLRIECIKSLFNAAGEQRYVREAIKDIARDFFEKQTDNIRVAAIRTLQAANQEHHIESFLKDIVKDFFGHWNPALRMAALKALGPVDMEAVRYFHLCFYQGKFIDPLEDE